MNKNIKNILHEKIIRINLTKINIFTKIKKSISQNNNITNNIKIYTNYTTAKILTKNLFMSRRHKICLFTGKRGGVLGKFNYSRYIVKNSILQNKCTNFKKNN